MNFSDYFPKKNGQLLYLSLLLQIINYIFIHFNIYILKQVTGIIYLFIVPGILIILFLNLELDISHLIVLSIGVSISVMMIISLIINEVLLLFGVINPISFIPVVINIFTLVLWFINYFYKNDDVDIKIDYSDLLRIMPIIVLPLLSVYGVIYMKQYNNNIFLIAMLLCVCLVFIYTLNNKKTKPYYPLILYIFSISILYHSSLISNYLPIYGSDSPTEYFVANLVLEKMKWTHVVPYEDYPNRVNVMIGVTILPALLSFNLGIDIIQIFRLIYPLIFAFVPVIMYLTWNKYFGQINGYISSFLFLSFNIYYTELVGLNKQSTAEFFLALLFMVIFNNNIEKRDKNILFVLFIFSITICHYSVALILLIFFILIFISNFMYNKYYKKTNYYINFVNVSLLSIFVFFWYIYTGNGVIIKGLLWNFDNVLKSIAYILDISSRESTILRGLGLVAAPNILVYLSRYYQYVTQMFIVAGFLVVINNKHEEKIKDIQIIFLFTICIAFIFLLIIIPGLSKTLNMTRFYHLLLIFISPLFTIGINYAVKILRIKKYYSMLIIIILIPYLLFQTHVIYEVAGLESWSIPLSKYRISPFTLFHYGYLDDLDDQQATFLKKYVTIENKVYSDLTTYIVVSYSRILSAQSYYNNMTVFPYKSIIVFSNINKQTNLIYETYYTYLINQTSNVFKLSKIYSNSKNILYFN